MKRNPQSDPREIPAGQSKERKTQKLEPLVIGRKNQAGLPTADAWRAKAIAAAHDGAGSALASD